MFTEKVFTIKSLKPKIKLLTLTLAKYYSTVKPRSINFITSILNYVSHCLKL